MGRYLSGAISYHRSTTGPEEERGSTMFPTDSYMAAEVSYRQQRVREDYGRRRRWTRTRPSHKKG